MSTMRKMLSRILGAAQKRFDRARPGSVLIMVVSLLVLLALIGTAAMSTARIDRVSSRQHISNVQIDLLVEGIKTLATSIIVDDLYSNGQFRNTWERPPEVTDVRYDRFDGNVYPRGNNLTAEEFAAMFWRNDGWLGSRHPVNGPAWMTVSFLSEPMLRNNTSADYEIHEPIPLNGTGPHRISFPALGFEIGVSNAIDGVRYPTMTYGGRKYMAADADGDGIADSYYTKIPMGTVGGVTYYYAVRIIDHNSAINPNVALSRDFDFRLHKDSSPAGKDNDFYPHAEGNMALTPANIGALEFIEPGWNQNSQDVPIGSSARLGNFVFGLNRDTKSARSPRLASAPANLPRVYGLPDDDQSALDDNNQPMNFHYGTLAEALYFSSGRRLDNPGYITRDWRVGSAGARELGGRPFGLTDAFAFADRFVLTPTTGLNTPLERVLDTLVLTRQTPYFPGDFALWYNHHFQFNNPTQLPLRSIFATHNPTANVAAFRLRPDPALLHMKDTGIQCNPVFNFQPKIGLNTAPMQEIVKGFADLMMYGEDANGKEATALGVTHAQALALDGVAENFTANDKKGHYYGQHFTNADKNDSTSSFNKVAEFHPGRMFRSVLRTHDDQMQVRTYFKPKEIAKLRAAIATANLMALRRGPGAERYTDNQDKLFMTLLDGRNRPYQVTVYGYKPQPFITEVFIHTDTSKFVPPTTTPDGMWPSHYKDRTNDEGFVAIELYNPYDQVIDLGNANNSKGYGLAIIKREGSSEVPSMEIKVLDKLSGEIPAKGYLVITNYHGGGQTVGDGKAKYPPTSINEGVFPDDAGAYDGYTEAPPLPNGNAARSNLRFLYVEKLGQVLGNEVVLMRNEEATGDFVQPLLAVPLDSYDASGIMLGSDDNADIYHYSRQNDPAQAPWACVYPGRYDGWGEKTRRHQGTQWANWKPNDPAEPTRLDPWFVNKNNTITFGIVDERGTQFPNVAGPRFPIQLFNRDMPGPFLGGAPRRYPYGGFARVGDVMHVPFIGRYRIRAQDQPDNHVVELNSISMDATFAEDTDVEDDDKEDIGRFSPLIEKTAKNQRDDQSKYNDYYDLGSPYPRGKYMEDNGDLPQGNSDSVRYHYRWATRVYDIFTAINNPSDDRTPNMDGEGLSVSNADAKTPSAVSDPSEQTLGSEGLINVNTANWRVLAAVPWIPSREGLNKRVPAIENVAKSIVYYRDFNRGDNLPHGPFSSLAELNRVRIYENFNANNIPTNPDDPACYLHDIWFYFTSGNTAPDADDIDGDISPHNGAAVDKQDNVKGDYEEKHLSLNRVSNLLSFNSDTFTVYILVQGWRDAETNNAKLEVQRRAAFIIDRSRVTGNNKTPKIYNIPGN